MDRKLRKYPWFCASLLPFAAVFVSYAAAAAEEGELDYVPDSTKRVCQLIGDVDRMTGLPTFSQTEKRFGIIGTDLGSSFEHKGKLFFLFGDTQGRPGDRDLLAWTTSSTPYKIVLDCYLDTDGKWLPLTVPGLKQGTFEVPSGGISINGVIYVVCTTDHTDEKLMGRSVLACSHDDGKTFKQLYELSRDKFINVSLLSADGWLYILGSGDYRKSSVCLARTRPGDFEDKATLRYFSGAGPDGPPKWLPDEAAAVVLFRHDQIGEFSVTWLPSVKRFAMLYNAQEPRGIIMRSAKELWGPWSEGTVIFEPWRDEGFGHFMHISSEFKEKKDSLSNPEYAANWGGEYGPYIIARFTQTIPDGCRIFYTMSTWNPYTTVVMQSDLKSNPGK